MNHSYGATAPIESDTDTSTITATDEFREALDALYEDGAYGNQEE